MKYLKLTVVAVPLLLAAGCETASQNDMRRMQASRESSGPVTPPSRNKKLSSSRETSASSSEHSASTTLPRPWQR